VNVFIKYNYKMKFYCVLRNFTGRTKADVSGVISLFYSESGREQFEASCR